jgi:hypothetical protein
MSDNGNGGDHPVVTPAQYASLIRVLFAAGGPAAAWLAQWGFSAVDIGNIANFLIALIAVLPVLYSTWSGFRANSNKNILRKAAGINGVRHIAITPNGDRELVEAVHEVKKVVEVPNVQTGQESGTAGSDPAKVP